MPDRSRYPDGFSCVILTDSRTYHQALVELLQATLSQVGITLEVQTMELAKQKEVMATGEGFDLFLLDNVGVPEIRCLPCGVIPTRNSAEQEAQIICSIPWIRKAQQNMRKSYIKSVRAMMTANVWNFAKKCSRSLRKT